MNIVVADTDRLFRDFLRHLMAPRPDLRVVAEAEQTADLVKAVRRHRPELVLLGLSLPAEGGLEAARAIKREWPRTRVIVFADGALEAYRRGADNAGVDGFLAKDAAENRILAALVWTPHQDYRKSA